MKGLSILSPQNFVAKDPNHLEILGLIRQYNEGGARLPRDSERLQYMCLTKS